MSRIISTVLILFMFCTLFTGCFDYTEVDKMAYVMAIGIDKGKTSNLKITLQVAIPKSLAGEGGDSEKAITTTTFESQTIYPGINLADTYISKNINLSHAKLLVFSKELIQQEDIKKYLHEFVRGREFRRDAFVLVSEGSAEEYIKKIKIQLEINPSKFYEEILKGYKETGLISKSEFHDLYINDETYAQQPAVALVGVNKLESLDKYDINNSSFPQKGRMYPLEGDYKGGNVPKTGFSNSNVMGSAVFKNGKMVGELDGEDTTYYLMVTGEFRNSHITIPDPLSKGEFLVLKIQKARNPVKKIDIQDEKNPKIQVDINLEADFTGIQSGINYEDPHNVSIIENAANAFYKDGITKFLNHTTKDFDSDICGFGRQVKSKFLTWNEWENFKWPDKYKKSTFTVNVDLKMRSWINDK